MVDEPSSYLDLYEVLKGLRQDLEKAKQARLAARIEHAMAHYGAGTPSEFLGETRLALRDLVANRNAVPEGAVATAERLIASIDRAFEEANRG